MTARTTTAPRACECCGSRFERRRFPSGQLERVSQFAKRRFCSVGCYRKASADGGRSRPVGRWVVEPYAQKAGGATVSGLVSGARATPANHPSRNAAVAVSALPGVRAAVPIPQNPNPRHKGMP